jgi:hypothetical protein
MICVAESKVQPKATTGQCCVVDCAMWDKMEAKVLGLVTRMNEMKELLFMNIGLGSNLGFVMFITTTVEGAHRVLIGGPNFKDMDVTLMPWLIDINPIPPTLM